MSTLIAETLSNGTVSTSTANCIQGSAKAWVNFNGSSAAIRDSYNVTSVTKNSTGNYTINLTNALSNANYATAGTAHDVSSTNKARFIGSYSKTTSANSIVVSYQDGLVIDATNVEVAMFD
jgi:hypothetical protein